MPLKMLQWLPVSEAKFCNGPRGPRIWPCAPSDPSLNHAPPNHTTLGSGLLTVSPESLPCCPLCLEHFPSFIQTHGSALTSFKSLLTIIFTTRPFPIIRLRIGAPSLSISCFKNILWKCNKCYNTFKMSEFYTVWGSLDKTKNTRLGSQVRNFARVLANERPWSLSFRGLKVNLSQIWFKVLW